VGRADRPDHRPGRPGRPGHHGSRKVIEVAGHLYLEAPKNRKRRRTIYPRATPAGYPLAEQLAARIEQACLPRAVALRWAFSRCRMAERSRHAAEVRSAMTIVTPGVKAVLICSVACSALAALKPDS
jgi:hypothetical protein